MIASCGCYLQLNIRGSADVSDPKRYAAGPAPRASGPSLVRCPLTTFPVTGRPSAGFSADYPGGTSLAVLTRQGAPEPPCALPSSHRFCHGAACPHWSTATKYPRKCYYEPQCWRGYADIILEVLRAMLLAGRIRKRGVRT